MAESDREQPNGMSSISVNPVGEERYFLEPTKLINQSEATSYLLEHTQSLADTARQSLHQDKH